jgi:hypothetical protein
LNAERVNIQSLRAVLLVQSIEESDRGGDVLPLADRAEATRIAVREARGKPIQQTGPMLSRAAGDFLAGRAEWLLARVRARSPAVDHVLAVAGGVTWLGRAVLVIATMVGLSLSALDGSHRINILSFPLIGLIAWNLFVYVALIVARVRWRRSGGLGPGTRPFWSGHFYERWIGRRVDALLHQSTRFNAPLATGLRRFASEWTAIVHPLLLQRAKVLMHLAAALIALGLIVGLYIRGLVFRYEAGWESTFLGASSVHTLAELFYGPAAVLTGIGLPTTDAIGALRWTGTSGGGEAASWIHLIALTAALYIVVPRWILAALSQWKLWRLSRNPPLPASLLAHARTLLVSAAGGVALDSVSVIPFAYEPGPESVAGLKLVLASALGGVTNIEVRGPVQYGQEEELRRQLEQGDFRPSQWVVLLMSVASTPEVENHGAVIGAVRDQLSQTASAPPLLVLIDTGPYAQRMEIDASLETRLAERRRLWSQFVAGYGLRACIVNLTNIVAGAPSELAARERVGAALFSSHSP